MQHKLNCIASLHTPISSVSHGHRAVLSNSGVCMRVCVGGIQQGTRTALHPLVSFQSVTRSQHSLPPVSSRSPVPCVCKNCHCARVTIHRLCRYSRGWPRSSPKIPPTPLSRLRVIPACALRCCRYHGIHRSPDSATLCSLFVFSPCLLGCSPLV